MHRLFFKLLCFAIIGISLVGCEADTENHKPLAVTGNLTDDAGSPLPNILVTAQINDYSMEQRTNAAGKFQFAALENDDDDFEIRVNPPLEDTDTTYTSFIYRNTASKKTKNEDIYDLGQISLSEKVNFQFRIKKTSKKERSLQVSFSLQNPNCPRSNRESIDPEEERACDSLKTISEKLNASNPNLDQTFVGIRNTKVHVEYQIDDQKKQRFTIPLTDEKNSYEMEY